MMNNKNKTISILLFVGLLITSCSNNPSNIWHKNIKVHTSIKDIEEVEVYFFNNNDIPYVEISDTVNKLLNPVEYKIELDGNIYTITSRYNDSIMTLSTEGIVSYPDFDKFHATYEDENNCYIDEFRTESFKCQKLKNQSTYIAPKEYRVDLSKYGFKPIANGENYYLPLNVLHSLIMPDIGTFYLANDGEIYLYGKNKEMNALVNTKIKTAYSDLKAFFEYNFNQFSLLTELCFGLKGYSRTLRTDRSILKYFPNGVLAGLSPYKDKIINSKTFNEFDLNLTTVVNTLMTDGGHTSNFDKSLANPNGDNIPEGEEVTLWFDYKDKGDAERKIRKDDGFDTYLSSFDTDEDGKDDIGYITFDGFETEDNEEALAIQNIFRGKDGANQLFNKNATGYDTSNYDIKDVVIDLSLNGGGSVAAEGYLLSWICGGVAQQTLKATNGGGYSTFTYNYDVNGDDLFDKQDYLPDDVNVYILMSPVTYSAANALVFDTYLYNPKLTRQVKFIGQQTGGGACSVIGPCFLPTGYSCRYAYNDASIYPNNQTVCCEDGIYPSTGLEIKEFKDIFHRTGKGGINELIVGKRGK